MDATLKLFCSYLKERFRVTFASRLGHVGLARDMSADHGYDEFADVAECCGWGEHQ